MEQNKQQDQFLHLLYFISMRNKYTNVMRRNVLSNQQIRMMYNFCIHWERLQITTPCKNIPERLHTRLQKVIQNKDLLQSQWPLFRYAGCVKQWALSSQVSHKLKKERPLSNYLKGYARNFVAQYQDSLLSTGNPQEHQGAYSGQKENHKSSDVHFWVFTQK